MISQSLSLPCGVTIKNRIAKSAMSENMAQSNHTPGDKYFKLYSQWAQGGAGLVITGNVMIDRGALGEPNNVVVEDSEKYASPSARAALKSWAEAGTRNGTQLWMQLNHPGKQSPKFLSPTPVGPSAIAYTSHLKNMFNEPRELTEAEIQAIIKKFGDAAKIAKEAGFTGVQIHGAHGYLVSQFLSPLHNQRKDQWGGSLENRMRFAVQIYHRIRAEVGPKFPIGMKLNSADFQKGGFSEEESMAVIKTLDGLGLDLIEISGGTYEAPKMMGIGKKASTKAREAFFLDYCEKVRSVAKIPLLLTGGFRTAAGMNAALKSGACDSVGLARALAIDPSFPNKILAGENAESLVQPLTSGSALVDKMVPLEITWYTNQLHRIGSGKQPDPNASVMMAIVRSIFEVGLASVKKVRA